MEWLRERIAKHKDDPEYLTEGQILMFTEAIVKKMIDDNITRTELAKRLGKSKPFITKLLDGSQNMTIFTMVNVANALGMRLNIDIYPKDFTIARQAIYAYSDADYNDSFIPSHNETENPNASAA